MASFPLGKDESDRRCDRALRWFHAKSGESMFLMFSNMPEATSTEPAATHSAPRWLQRQVHCQNSLGIALVGRQMYSGDFWQDGVFAVLQEIFLLCGLHILGMDQAHAPQRLGRCQAFAH